MSFCCTEYKNIVSCFETFDTKQSFLNRVLHYMTIILTYTSELYVVNKMSLIVQTLSLFFSSVHCEDIEENSSVLHLRCVQDCKT